MLWLILIVEITALMALGFLVAASVQGTVRIRDWSLTSPYHHAKRSPRPGPDRAMFVNNAPRSVRAERGLS
jgi:hypothetical protein